MTKRSSPNTVTLTATLRLKRATNEPTLWSPQQQRRLLGLHTVARSVSCRNETDTSAFVDCKNRKKTYGCFRHYISDKQARFLKEKTKGRLLLKTEGAFLLLVLFLLSKTSWLHYFIKTLTCDVVETNAESSRSEIRAQSKPWSEKMLISVSPVFLSLGGCSSEPPGHTFSGAGHLHASRSLRCCRVKGKRVRYTGRHKLLLRGQQEHLLVLY